MKIFISWSKNKSRMLAEATKRFLENTLGHSIEFFFSPQMYKGTRVDHEIHINLTNSQKCIVCITSENFKNPWLLYEAGVVFGVNYKKTDDGIIIPILFERIPEWSSWIDKPLNQYTPIQIQPVNHEFSFGKKEFLSFIQELSDETGVSIKEYDQNWQLFESEIKQIIDKEQIIPPACKFLVDRILEKDDGSFSIVSPEITKHHIIFHKGFATNRLYRILLENIVDFQGKRLWIYGRRNKRLLTSENNYFFRFLSEEGLRNGVDFKCLFPYPHSEATKKAVCKEKERSFFTDLQTCMEKAIALKNKYQLPVEELFRVYDTHRDDSIIICDNSLLHRRIICDGNGYPLPYTNSEFEILDIPEVDDINSKGQLLYNAFQDVWNASIPLTKDLYNRLYKENI